MRLSVVIPAYNAESTIERAVRSASGQTRRPDEIVVVDDGSTDSTVQVLQAVEPGLAVVRCPRGGPAAARNVGVKAATGDWIAFLDADDEWHPDKLAYQMRHADHSTTAIVATDWSRSLVTSSVPSRVATTSVSTGDILLLNRFQTSTVVMRRRTIEEVGGFDSSLDGVEDWDMWLRGSRQGLVLKVNWPFVRYTDTNVGYSKATERVYQTGILMLKRELGEQPDRRGRTILAWHHLRFAVAFVLVGDQAGARRCLSQIRQDHLATAAPEAATRYLAPFLAGRLRRRLPIRSGTPTGR